MTTSFKYSPYEKNLSIPHLLSPNVSNRSKKKQPNTIKQPLTHDLYDGWKEIPYKGITPDGRFVALTINPQEGDGKAVFYDLKKNTVDSVRRASDISLTFDSRYAVFRIKPPLKQVKDLRRQKKEKGRSPERHTGHLHIRNKKDRQNSRRKIF